MQFDANTIRNQCLQFNALDVIRDLAYLGAKEPLQYMRQFIPLDPVAQIRLDAALQSNDPAQNGVIFFFLHENEMIDHSDKPKQTVLTNLVKRINKLQTQTETTHDGQFHIMGLFSWVQTVHGLSGTLKMRVYCIQLTLPYDFGRYEVIGTITPCGRNNNLGSVIEYHRQPTTDPVLKRWIERMLKPENQNVCTDCGERRFRLNTYAINDKNVTVGPRPQEADYKDEDTYYDALIAHNQLVNEKYQSLGSACLRKYVTPSVIKLIDLIEALREERKARKAPNQWHYRDLNTTVFEMDTKDYIATVMCVYRLDGRYVPLHNPRYPNQSTGMIALDFMIRTGQGHYVPGNYVASDIDRDMAQRVVDYIHELSLDGDTKVDGRKISCIQMLKHPVFMSYLWHNVVYAVELYLEAQKKLASEAKSKQCNPTGYHAHISTDTRQKTVVTTKLGSTLGNPGDSVSGNFYVNSISDPKYNNYGQQYVVVNGKMNGCNVTVFAKNSKNLKLLEFFQVGYLYNLAGTIYGPSSFKGTTSTIVTVTFAQMDGDGE